MIANLNSNKHVDKSKIRKNTKIKAIVDAKCQPIKIFLSSGNVNNIKIAPQLLDSITLNDYIIIANKAYCTRKFLRLIEIKVENK